MSVLSPSSSVKADSSKTTSFKRIGNAPKRPYKPLSFGVAPSSGFAIPQTAQEYAIPCLLRPPHWLFKTVLNSRTKEMLAEDFLGFGLFRTAIDLYRQRIMEGKKHRDAKYHENHDDLNIPAAFERIFRETASILADNVLGGVMAFAVAGMAGRWAGSHNISHQFVSDNTLQLFRELCHDMTRQNTLSATPDRFRKNFLNNLARKLQADPQKLETAYESWTQYQQAVTQKQPEWRKNKFKSRFQTDLTQLAQNIHHETAEGYGVTLPISKSTGRAVRQQAAFTLNELIEDTGHFTNKLAEMAARQKAVFSESHAKITGMARKILSDTAKMNQIQFSGIAAALGMTFLAPFGIQAVTRKVFRIASYPGDKGIRRMVPVEETQGKPWYERHFPFLTDCIRKKNPVFLLTLLPLMAAFGMFDMRELSAFRFKAAFNNPLRPVRYLERLKDMYRFGKGFPFTTQQQMATGFAFVIASRMLTARSDNEFRERTMDSFLGWATWILATPMLKRMLSQSLERRISGVRLLNSAKNLRTEEEITHFRYPGENPGKSMTAHLWIKYGSTLFTILALGLIEPFMAVKWTGYLGKKAQEKQQSSLPPEALKPSNIGFYHSPQGLTLPFPPLNPAEGAG